MSKDIRLSVDFFSNFKTRRLKKKLGDTAILCLIELWIATAQSKPTGVLAGMSIEDIEIAANWQGDEGVFVQALTDVGFLDFEDGTYSVHDWTENNPYVATGNARSEKARRASNARWGVEHEPKMLQAQSSNATSMNEQCYEHEPKMLQVQSSNAPSPSPSPSPSHIPLSPNPLTSAEGGEPPPTPEGETREREPLAGDLSPDETDWLCEELGISALAMAQGQKAQTLKRWLRYPRPDRETAMRQGIERATHNALAYALKILSGDIPKVTDPARSSPEGFKDEEARVREAKRRSALKVEARYWEPKALAAGWTVEQFDAIVTAAANSDDLERRMQDALKAPAQSA